MKSRVIPTTENPWMCCINGTVYCYKAGSTQNVPDEVAELIDLIKIAEPKEAPAPGSVGQVWTRTSEGAGWKDVPTYTLPTATATKLGGVKQGVAVADAASTAPTAAEFKALLDSLRTAGIIATASE